MGLNGVSYLAVSQWHVAALKPPNLGCICPDEGWTDFYREVLRHGGIPCTSFFPYIATRWGASINQPEDLVAESKAHPFFDALWESKKAKLENIQVPALVIASFADQGLHTRGTLEGFKKIASKEKWLICHRRKKWEFYYMPEIVEKQRAFYDKFLKNVQGTQVESWPRVLLEIGNRFYDGIWREEDAWPLTRQVLTPIFLDADAGLLSFEQPNVVSTAKYHSLGSGPAETRAIFKMRFSSPTEITGHISARLFMMAEEGNDMDIFLAIYKLDQHGNVLGQTYYAQYAFQSRGATNVIS